MRRGEKTKVNAVDRLVGRNIKKYRRLKELTQKELGNLLNPSLSYQQIQKYETGRNRIYINTLYQISLALDVDIQDLFPF